VSLTPGPNVLEAVATDGVGHRTTARVTVTYQPALTVTKNEAVGGMVLSSPAGIACGLNCRTQSASFPVGTTVTLTAIPAAGWEVGSWTGCDRVNGNQCIVTMNMGRVIGVNFQVSSTTCPGKPWSWGAYDWLSCPALTLEEIANVVVDMAGRGFRGFRTFMNAYFDPKGEESAYQTCRGSDSKLNQRGVQPYAYDSQADKFDLCRWDTVYWDRVAKALDAMVNWGYRKIMFTIGHKYQGPNPSLPWVNNTNGVNICNLAGNCDWITGWNSLKQRNVPTCDFTGPADQWVIHEYKKLIRKLLDVAGTIQSDVADVRSLIVIEIYNEANPEDSDVLPAHCEIIQALRSEFPNLRIQVNIDPPWGANAWDDWKCGDQFLRDLVETWAVHGLTPETLSNVPADIFSSGKLEISTDGQWCEGSISICCDCCHVHSGELLDAAIQQAGGDAKNLPFAFEHDTGLVRTSLPPANGIAWQAWELDEVQCLYQGHCGGTGCTGAFAGDVKGKKEEEEAPFSDRPLTVDVGSIVRVFWDATFSTSTLRRTFTCSVPGVGSGTAGCGTRTAGCGTTTVALYCNNTLMDTLELRTCGNGVCDTQCETPDNCALDCGVRPPPPVVTLRVNGSEASPVPVFGNTYRVDWTSRNATACTLTQDGQTVSTDLNGSLDWPIGNVCDVDDECPQPPPPIPVGPVRTGDQVRRCESRPDVYYDETWVLTCSNVSGSDSKTVTARVHPRVCSAI
jgi:hypothetical protein